MYVKITREYCFWWLDEVQDEVMTMAHHIALFIPYFIATLPYSPSLVYVPVFVDVLPSFVDWRRRQFFSLASILSPHFFSIFVVHRTRVFIGCVSGLRSGPSAGGEARRACVPADAQSMLVAGWWFQCLKLSIYIFWNISNIDNWYYSLLLLKHLSKLSIYLHWYSLLLSLSQSSWWIFEWWTTRAGCLDGTKQQAAKGILSWFLSYKAGRKGSTWVQYHFQNKHGMEKWARSSIHKVLSILCAMGICGDGCSFGVYWTMIHWLVRFHVSKAVQAEYQHLYLGGVAFRWPLREHRGLQRNRNECPTSLLCHKVGSTPAGAQQFPCGCLVWHGRMLEAHCDFP